MKSYIALFAAGLSAGLASAAANPDAIAAYEYLDVVPLEARQETTDEKFECHANCGYAILGSDDGNTEHCDNSTWLGFFDECLKCAEEFDIWQHYGEGVTEGAEACDLEATPSADDDASSTAEETGAASTPSADAETEENEEESGDGDSAGSHMTSSGSMILFAMIAAAALM